MPSPPLKWICIQGYRAARELEFEPGSLMALVGEASSGKSTVLTAIWTLLEAAAPPPTIEDISRGATGRIHLEAELDRGSIFLDATPPDTLNLNRAGAPPVLFLPANLRSRTMVAPATGSGAADVAELLRPPLADHHWAAADGGLALVRGMERLLASNLRKFVLLIEEPELYLSPHAQRHLHRVLRQLAERGNQILYSTHAPVFLSVDRVEELALVRHTADGGTSLFQPEPLEEAKSFRALSEFDSDRAELFLARAALLVEGRTEKMIFPLVFERQASEAAHDALRRRTGRPPRGELRRAAVRRADQPAGARGGAEGAFAARASRVRRGAAGIAPTQARGASRMRGSRSPELAALGGAELDRDNSEGRHKPGQNDQ